MKTKLSLLLATAAFTLFGTVNAVVIFSENFEDAGITAGSTIDAADTAFGDINPNVGSGSASLDVVAGNSNIFGTGNKYATFIDTNGSSGTFAGAGASGTTFSANLVTWQFDFYDSGLDDGTGRGLFTRLDTAVSNTQSDDYLQVGIQDGSFLIRNNDSTNDVTGSYSLNTAYKLSIFANNSGSDVSNYFGGETLENDTYDLWLTQGTNASTFIGTGAFGPTADSNNFQGLAIQSFNGASTVDMSVDNFELHDEVFTDGLNVVPEPSTMVLVGLVGLASLIGIRRRK